MSEFGIRAFALLSSTHQDEFEEVCVAAIDTGDAIIIRDEDARASRVGLPSCAPDPHLALPGHF